MLKPPVQTRAVRTHEKLMAALETLLKSREFEHIAITEIASEAGVAVGSVYSHFKDKNAFLEEMLDHRLAQLEERLDEAERSTPLHSGRPFPNLRAALEAAVAAGHEQTRNDAHITRAIFTYIRLHSTGPSEAQSAVTKRAFSRVVALLEHYRDEIVVEDLNEAAQVVNYILNTIFLDKAMFANGSYLGECAPEEKVLLNAAVDMTYGYLTGAAR